MRSRIRGLARAVPLLLAAAACAQPATPSATPRATIVFEYTRPGLSVPHFVLTLTEDGSGTYAAEVAPAPVRGYPAAADAEPTPVRRSLSVSAPAVAAIFASARSLDLFHVECASPAKNIADSGAKKLTYTGPDGTGSCAYNYSELKPVVAMTTQFLAIAATLDEGRALDFKHRFDRLGLDAEIASLARQSGEGQAVELLNIKPTLEAIASDHALLERVRLAAAKLLERAGAGK